MAEQESNLPEIAGRAENASATWFNWLVPDFINEWRGMVPACRMFGCRKPVCEKDCGRKQAPASGR